MKCIENDTEFIEYIENSLSNEKRREFENHLKHCRECSERFDAFVLLFQSIESVEDEKPDKKMELEFEKMLENESKRHAHGKDRQLFVVRKSVLLKIAASIIFILCGYLVGRYSQKPMKENKTADIELRKIHDEVKEMKKLVLFSMIQDESASTRIKAVGYASEIPVADPKVILSLSNMLNNDKNTNVRIAAATALARFSAEESVRNILIAALARQNDPNVQIALINILVEMEEKRAIAPLRKIIKNASTLDLVKQHAEKSLAVLL